MSDTIVMIMAGGKGSRLGPLTTHRAKPATPFGGRYRIIDFVLSNMTNSGYRQIYVLTQYMAASLIRHMNRTWHFSGYDEFIEFAPAQMRRGEHWYRGTADSVYQNIHFADDHRARHIAVFGGDHIYKCDVSQMEAAHRDLDADLTIAAFPVPKSEASQFGVIEVDGEGRILGFQEKPENPKTIPGRPDTCLVSMGNYFFRAEPLRAALEADAQDPDSSHDFGKNIIPSMLSGGLRIYVYDFSYHRVPGDPPDGKPYWRDVGTIDSYFEANMDLRSPLPRLNLYNREWRIRTSQRFHPPARFVRHMGRDQVDVNDCLICEGTVIESARLQEAMIGYDCFVHDGASIEYSMLMSGCSVGSGAKIKGVICDKNVFIEPGVSIGYDAEEDKRRFPFITERGIVVLPKGTHVYPDGRIVLAGDMAELLTNDPATKDALAAVEIAPTMAKRSRHSYRSQGPRAQETHT
jgi:glucose-1-phosphate adenylyltransferase